MSTDPYTQEPEEIGDTSKYIRTYAKDMAALSGKGSQQKAAPTPPPPPPKKEVTTDGVALPEVDESLITQDRLRKTGDEPIDLNDAPTSGPVSVLEQTSAAAPAPAHPAPMPLGPSLNPERDAILARLKARVAQKPAPTFDEPAQEVPHIPPVAKPAPPPPPPPRPAPPPPPPAPAPKAPERPERFHSFSTDAAQHIDTARESKFSALAKQADRERRTVTTTRSARPSVKPSAVVATVFVVAGLGLIGATAYMFLARPGEIAIAPSVPTLIAADETKELEGVTGPELLRALRDAANEPLVAGNVLVTYVSTASSSPKGIPFRTPEPGGTLIKALPILAPDILLRNIRPESTVGVISAGDETRAFFILKVSSFERTFAGMLAWERDMRAGLSVLYPEYPNAPVDTSVEVGSSTPPVVAVAPDSFVDAVVRNYDVRILRDAGGRSIMLYGYRDKETLIIARDEAAFLALVARLDAKGE